MAAEWDNLITDSRGLPINGSFNDNKEFVETSKKSGKKPQSGKSKHSATKKKDLSPSSSEQSFLSEEQEEYVVTEYVMEYTDIFEPSQQKLDFIDVQEGDAISDVTDEDIVAHSAEHEVYEDTNVGTPHGEPEGRSVTDEDVNVGTLENNEDNNPDDRITEKKDGPGELCLEEKKAKDVDDAEVEPKEEIAEGNQEESEGNGLNNEQTQEELEVSPRTGNKVEEERKSHSEDDLRQSDDEELEEREKFEEEDDDEDETTEADKLLEGDKSRQDETASMKKQKHHGKRDGGYKTSAGTQSEAEPLLNTSRSHSPTPRHSSPVHQARNTSPPPRTKNTPLPSRTKGGSPSPRPKKAFSPKAYPGKVVKSVAIGTDDQDITDLFSTSRIKNTSTQAGVEIDGQRSHRRREKEHNGRVRENSKTAVSKNRRKVNGEMTKVPGHRSGDRIDQSSDANFFRARLPQTSKRHPRRHVWLCRDSEIHRLIAEKASILRRYKEEGITGRGRSRGFPNYSEVDVLGLPSVGYSGETRDDSHRMSFPYGKHPSSRSSQSYRSYGEYSSEDEDERTNRLGVKGAKPSGTFAVGLAARRDNLKNKQEQHEQQQHLSDDGADGCELCAAEAREKEKHEKRLKELENAAKAGPHHPRNLMLGIVYSAKFLGSTNLMSPATPNKAVRLQQAQEAIGRIKVPEGEEQPTTDVDLFISTERIKVVSAEQKQTLLDHHLKTISFIADIGNIIVVMARLSAEHDSKAWSGKMPDFKTQDTEKTARVVCHVLETNEAQTIAKTVGQAFSIAYHEFLKVNQLNLDEIEDAEYNGILEQQKILGEDLSLLADESKAKEIVIHKKYGESLSMMIVESGWGSMIPTVIIAHLDNKGPAAKSGQLNVGNQILAVNGQSLVGLPLLECSNIIRSMKYEERVALKVVFCPPTVEISINRPDTKYQLGFSVQNGMICSLMRGGIAERGGVRVGHKIIELNGESVVAASHHHIVDILQTTIGELQMKTMPITLYKLLVGLEIPQYL